MKSGYRQLATGGAAGVLAGLAHSGLLFLLHGLPLLGHPGGIGGWMLHLLFSFWVGAAYARLFTPPRDSWAENLMSGLAWGLLWWIVWSLSLVPIARGEGPQWQAQAVAALFPALIGNLFQGAVLGLGHALLWVAVRRRWGAPDESAPAPRRAEAVERILIAGGGFAGVETARHLERLFAGGDRVAITLVSDTNYLLFTPMLSEVTAGSVEARHISAPLRTFLRRTHIVYAGASAVDLEKGTVRLFPRGDSISPELPFDHLVLALGSVPHFFGLQDLEAQAFTFKSLEDAILLRNHVIAMLERADAETNPQRRRALLTFVVAGGGFAGAELIGALNDFVRGALWYYPAIPPGEVSLFLVHSHERILPELSPQLAAYARERLEERGVEFALGTRVVHARAGAVVLGEGRTLRSETLVWTAGNSPHPLIRTLGLELDKRGRVKTDSTLAVLGRTRIWALGDCAAIPDLRTGELCPPTAQHALREAATLAHNLCAGLRGSQAKPFNYRSLGSLVVLGHQTACAEIRGLKFSGMLAWWLWRAVYLAKMPTLEKKVRVALDWTVDLFFPRDIVQTFTARPPEGSRGTPQRAA